MKKILITGINGFIGKTLNESFNENEYEIWGLARFSIFKNTRSINLLNENDCLILAKNFPNFDVIIHAASIAHSKFDNLEIFEKNLNITKNIINFFSNYKTQFIFLSSVSVYGEDKRNKPITIHDSLRPSSYYGKSKLKCEEIIMKSFSNCDILRLCPVYGINNLNDIKKRVIFPILSFFRMRIVPSPKYSFCNIELISFTINSIVKRGPKNKNIYNVCDNKPFSQKEISNCFKNQKLILPTFLFKPFYYLTYILTFEKGYKLRCLYWKFFKSNEYVCNLQNNHLNNKEMLIKLLNVNE
jgi:nucleoside-diphosphate-sugar epimerase